METWFKEIRSRLFILYWGTSAGNTQVSMFPLMLLFTHAFLNIFYWDIVLGAMNSTRKILVAGDSKASLIDLWWRFSLSFLLLVPTRQEPQPRHRGQTEVKCLPWNLLFIKEAIRTHGGTQGWIFPSPFVHSHQTSCKCKTQRMPSRDINFGFRFSIFLLSPWWEKKI